MLDRDENRVVDGKDLRREFLDGRDYTWERGISVLEVLIALSRRTAFNACGTPQDWAWKLLKHLKLTKSTDPLEGRKAQRVFDILETLIWRQYEPNGSGGFFPLKAPQRDQTEVEIWEQMQAYTGEMYHMKH